MGQIALDVAKTLKLHYRLPLGRAPYPVKHRAERRRLTSMRHRLRQTVLGWASVVCCGFLVPLGSPVGWEVLSFSGIPPNRATFERQGLRLDIDRSAGPIVYPLPQPTIVTRVRAVGRVSGRLSLDSSLQQGRPGADDYALRIGLVEAGTRRLGWFQRLTAASWVKRLFALAPDEAGISVVRFLNVAESPSHVGSARQHPLNDLFYEHVVTSIDAEGRFAIDHSLERATPVLAVWLGSDGDDTSSTFNVIVERIELD